MRGAVESVLAQTLSDFELLVVEDASGDATPEILRSFDDPRLRVIPNSTNLGQVPSLNRDLSEARGTYVARLDAHDRAAPERLERQIAVLDADDAVVGSWMEVIDAADKRLHVIRRGLDTYVDYVFFGLRDRLPLFHSCVTFRRDRVLALGGYDESLPLAEDSDLWRRIALECQESRVVPEPLVVFRTHERQQSWAGRGRQVANNALSHERFIGALGDDLPVRPLRLLLTADPALWDEIPSRTAARELRSALDDLLGGAESRLALAPVEADALRRRVSEHVAAVVLAAWRQGAFAYWRSPPPLYAFSLRAAPRGAGLSYAARVLAAPLRHPRRAATRGRGDPGGAA